HLQTPHKSDTQYQHAPTTTQEQFLHFYLFTLFHTYNPAYIHQDHSYPLPTLPPHASTTDKPHTQTTDKLHTSSLFIPQPDLLPSEHEGGEGRFGLACLSPP